MALTIAEREHRRFAAILSEFRFSDTDDVPLSDVLRGALVQLRHAKEVAEARAERAYTANISATTQSPPDWPWDYEWWKPSDDPIRNLVKAGALIAAEIDRLQRANVRPAPSEGETP